MPRLIEQAHRAVPAIAFLFLDLLIPAEPSQAKSPMGVQPLLTVPLNDLTSRLPPDTHVLFTAAEIERFLDVLDGTAPDWRTLYGHGHHDSGLDERLFALNRERDANRMGHQALGWRLAFRWSGELPAFDPENDGYRVVLGPVFIPTSWGLVRFKYEDLSEN